MIQKGSRIKVVDNSGAKIISCISVPKGYKRRYASSGDIIVASVKALRNKFKKKSKVKKGDIICAIIIRLINPIFNKTGTLGFKSNSAVLLNRQNKIKFIGTRIFGGIPKAVAIQKHLSTLKLVTLSAGILR